MGEKTTEESEFKVRDAALISMMIVLCWCFFQMDRGSLWAILAGLVIFGSLHILYPLIVFLYCRKNEESRKTTGIVILVLFWLVFLPYMSKASAIAAIAASDAQGALIYFFGPVCANALLTVLAGIYLLVRYLVRMYRNRKLPEE